MPLALIQPLWGVVMDETHCWGSILAFCLMCDTKIMNYYTYNNILLEETKISPCGSKEGNLLRFWPLLYSQMIIHLVGYILWCLSHCSLLVACIVNLCWNSFQITWYCNYVMCFCKQREFMLSFLIKRSILCVCLCVLWFAFGVSHSSVRCGNMNVMMSYIYVY